MGEESSSKMNGPNPHSPYARVTCRYTTLVQHSALVVNEGLAYLPFNPWPPISRIPCILPTIPGACFERYGPTRPQGLSAIDPAQICSLRLDLDRIERDQGIRHIAWIIHTHRYPPFVTQIPLVSLPRLGVDCMRACMHDQTKTEKGWDGT